MEGYEDRIFVDESGCPDLEGDSTRMFVAAAVFLTEGEEQRLGSNFADLKEKYLRRTDVVLHGYEIRRNKPPFDFGGDEKRQNDFKKEIGKVVEGSNFLVVAACIDKIMLKAQYCKPYDPYETAVSFCMERVCFLCQRVGRLQGVLVVAERSGPAKDKTLRRTFETIQLTGRYGAMNCYVKSGLSLEFSPKSLNMPGLELADLVAGAVRQLVENPCQPNRAVESIRSKFYAPRGRLIGCGLKLFPEDERIRRDVEAWWPRGAAGGSAPGAAFPVPA